jgi:protoheme IX farnesyltransferase
MTQKNKFKAYIDLVKPGIILGNLITCLSGFFLASKGTIDFRLMAALLVGLAFIIASGCVFNNYIDRKSDEKMERTKLRPLVTKQISEKSARTLGLALFFSGSLILIYGTNSLAFSASMVGFFVYIFFYTLLKYKTPHATLIGSISGAMPPVVGYLAQSNSLDLPCFILFLIVVFWQMPHFYAIALYRGKEYEAASIPVLPNVKGIKAAKIEMLFYTIAYVFSCLLLSLLGFVGNMYLILASLLGAYWILLSIKGFTSLDTTIWAKKMFRFSLVVVTILSTAIYIDKLVL